MEWIKGGSRIAGVVLSLLFAIAALGADTGPDRAPYSESGPYLLNDGPLLPQAAPGIAPLQDAPQYSAGNLGFPSGTQLPPRLVENGPKNTFYARVDYFNWRESEYSSGLLEETGPLISLGFLRRTQDVRFRAELFGGRMDYDGQTWDGEPIGAKTDYFGFRAQYDLLWPLASHSDTFFTLGLGTRLWNRHLGDTQTADGFPVEGYDETWWTVYPTIGMEVRRPMGPSSEFFASASLGWTGFTYQRIPEFDANLYPKMGPLAQGEVGFQGPRLSIAFYVEWMQWYTSGLSGDPQVYQPESRMFTLGISGGYRF